MTFKTGPVLRCSECGYLDPLHEDGCTYQSEWQPCGRPHLPSTEIGRSPYPEGSMCSNCEPRRCTDCGQMDHPDALCACWISLDGMNFADVKAEMVSDGWNVDTHGKLSQ